MTTKNRSELPDSDPRTEAAAKRFAPWNNTDSPGAAAMVVRDRSVVFERGFGMADIESGKPITPSTVFDAASIGKHFTGYAVSTLIEQGLMAADDDIRKYLPEVPDFGRTITIRHLLHHTSGLRDWGGGAGTDHPPHPHSLTTAGILEMVTRETTLDFEPGTQHKYSNTGYNLLAAAAERITRQPLRGWMDENVFKPLSMNSTQLREDLSALVANLASLYYANPAGGWIKDVVGPAPIGSSSLYTSARDFAKWLISMATAEVGGQTVLQRMREPGELNDGRRVDYGFGLRLGEIQGRRMIGHGGAFGYISSFCYVPESKLGVVVLSNTGVAEVWKMAAQIASAWLG